MEVTSKLGIYFSCNQARRRAGWTAALTFMVALCICLQAPGAWATQSWKATENAQVHRMAITIVQLLRAENAHSNSKFTAAVSRLGHDIDALPNGFGYLDDAKVGGTSIQKKAYETALIDIENVWSLAKAVRDFPSQDKRLRPQLSSALRTAALAAAQFNQVVLGT